MKKRGLSILTAAVLAAGAWRDVPDRHPQRRWI